MNVRYWEESRGVTAIQWIPAPPPLPPSHAGSVHGTFLASRGACSCRGRQFANSTHSDMIDNRKPLRGPDDFFFKCSCRPPRVMKKCRPGRLPGSPVPKTAPPTPSLGSLSAPPLLVLTDNCGVSIPYFPLAQCQMWG